MLLILSFLGLSTGWSGSGLYPTRNRPNHFEFPMPRPAADQWKESVQVVGFSSGTDRSVGFRLWEILPDFAKSCRIWRDLAGSWWDLGGSWRDQAESRRDLAGSRWDLGIFRTDLAWSLRVQVGSRQIGQKTSTNHYYRWWTATFRSVDGLVGWKSIS